MHISLVIFSGPKMYLDTQVILNVCMLNWFGYKISKQMVLVLQNINCGHVLLMSDFQKVSVN